MNRQASTRRVRFSRREALRIGGLGAAGVIGAVLVGCGSGDDTEAGATAPQSATTPAGSTTPEVRRGGKLVLRDTPQTQDFHRHTGTMPSPSLVADTPTAIDANGETKNFLLERFEAPDASNYTFTFRPGVKFHNGREMTSEDVKLNLERIKATKGAWLKSTADLISSMTTPDARTLTVKLSQPYSPMLSLLSELWILAPESPGWNDQITQPIGTGPFAWKQWIPNDRIELTAHREYWRTGQPYIDSIEIKNLSSDPGPALLAGDLHISGVSLDQSKLLANNANVSTQLEKATSWQFLSFNNRKPRAPYEDVRVRQAIAHALDKAALNEFANGATGVVADQMAPPKSFYWASDIVDPFAKRDLAKARQLLDAAGVKAADLKPVMPVNTDPKQPQVVEAQLRELGITADLQVADDVTTETRLQSYDWDIYYAGSGPRSDIALRFVRLLSDGPNPGLWGGPQDPEYDRLVKDAWATVDAEQRKQKYAAAWRRVMDKMYTVVVYHRSGTTAIRKEVQGWQTGAVANFNRIDGGAASIQLNG